MNNVKCLQNKIINVFLDAIELLIDKFIDSVRLSKYVFDGKYVFFFDIRRRENLTV